MRGYHFRYEAMTLLFMFNTTVQYNSPKMQIDHEPAQDGAVV